MVIFSNYSSSSGGILIIPPQTMWFTPCSALHPLVVDVQAWSGAGDCGAGLQYSILVCAPPCRSGSHLCCFWSQLQIL